MEPLLKAMKLFILKMQKLIQQWLIFEQEKGYHTPPVMVHPVRISTNKY